MASVGLTGLIRHRQVPPGSLYFVLRPRALAARARSAQRKPAPLKILIIRLSAIGDTIHSLPVAAALKRRTGEAEITWLSEPASLPLLEGNPAVDRVVCFPKKAWLNSAGKPWLWPGTFTGIGALVSELRSARFDLVLELQALFKSGIWAGLSGSPVRVGFAHAREGSQIFLTDRVDVGDYFGPDRHVVDLNLSLVDYACRRLGIAGSEGTGPASAADQVEFPLPAPPEESARKIDQALAAGGSDRPVTGGTTAGVAVLIPGTTWPSKIWDWQSWTKLAQFLSSRLGYRICLIGADSESATNGQIAGRLQNECPGMSLLDLTGQTSLVDLIALFKRVDLVVGADTGPLHLAAATGRPKVVGVYGSTPTGRNGPYGPQCRTVNLGLSCQPCFEKICPLSTTACLKDLTPDRVFSEITHHLES